jgi:hypothetical protein
MAHPPDGRLGGTAEFGAAAPAVSGALMRVGVAAPLTERILSRLPGPRLPSVVAWSLAPWLNLAVVVWLGAAGWGWTDIPFVEVLNRAAVSFAVVLSLWGAARIAAELRTLPGVLARVVEQDQPDVEQLFRSIDSIMGPLLLVVAVGVVLPLDEAAAGDPVGALIQAATWLIIGVPLCTAFWVYAALQLGLNRLGRGHLTLQAYHGDRSLGLLPVGRLAFTGFWMLFGTVAPIVLTGHSDLPTAVVGITVLATAVGLFFLSLRRVHRQMVAVKQRELDWALDLYTRAHDRVRDQPTLDVLQENASLLKAAEDLEKRAERIQEWPFDEPTFARVVTIASSVTAAIIARIILDPVGL